MLTDKSIEIELKCSIPCSIDYSWVSIKVLFVRGERGKNALQIACASFSRMFLSFQPRMHISSMV